ncbi:MAG: hypothetical protein RLY31_1276 [Bacteroidota bacterium]
MEHNQFDDHIRRVLSGLDAPPEPNRWDRLSRQLDQADAETAAENLSELDAHLRRRMQGLEVAPGPESTWSGLETRIAASEQTTDQETDQLLHERFQRMMASYQPSHWQLMAKRLEEEFSLWYRFRRYRIAEAVLTLLLLLTCFRFAPWNEPSWQLPHLKQTLEHFAQHILSSERPDLVSVTAQTAADAPALDPAPAEAPSDGPPPPEAPPYMQETDPGQIERLASLPLSVRQTWETISRPPAEPVALPKDRPAPSGNLAFPTDLPVLPPRFATTRSDWAQTIPPLPQYRRKKRQIRFSLLGSSDISHVFSPSNQLDVFDTLVPTPSATTLASGYGGGILISWKNERWELQTGGRYSFKRYIPNTPVFFFETVNYYIREEFRGVQLDLLQLPVNLQYHVKDDGNWRFYGSFGASGYLVTSSVYEIDHRKILAVKAPNGPPAAEEALLEDNSSIRTEQDLPDGLVDGGRLRNNFYLTANLGFGVERFVTPRWTLFVQPEYQHFLHAEGIGVNRERFYTLSFNMGTKVSLK